MTLLQSTSSLTPYDPSGKLPYHRNAEAGGTDHVMSAVWGKAMGEDLGDEAVALAVREAVAALSSGEAPLCLRAAATGVAVAVSVEGGDFKYVEFYADQYVALSSVPTEISGSEMSVSGKVLAPASFGPFCAVVYHSPAPVPLSEEELRASPPGYFDFADNCAAVVWPWELSYDNDAESETFGEFQVPISFKTVPLPGEYYVQLFVRQDPDNIPYRAPTEGLDVPGAAYPATGLVVTVHPSEVEHTSVHASEECSGTVEERSAKVAARQAAGEPDPLPVAALLPLAGHGLVVPASTWEHSLFAPVERQELGTVRNLTVALQRIKGGVGTEEGATGITGVEFVVAGPGEEPKCPPGYELMAEDLCNMLGGEEGTEGTGEGEEKKGGDGDMLGDATRCYIAVKREEVEAEGNREDAFLVDVAVVYGEPGFEMGAGYTTRRLPECVCEAYSAPVFVCTKMEGDGKKAMDEMDAIAAKDANEGLMKQMGDDGSVGEGGGGDDELSVDA
ncbi:hypothetical protein TeGR_g11894, partial [Tetraparma gracilis]